MIKSKDIKEILNYISIAADSLEWKDKRQIENLKNEVESLIILACDHKRKMRPYVEKAYENATILYSTGHSLLFYKKHNENPIQLRFCFKTDPDDMKTWIMQNKLPYITDSEYHIILELLKTDHSKRLCNSLCIGFWKSEENASQYHMPVSFSGENTDYCDKSLCE
jgi:hypothetical protein